MGCWEISTASNTVPMLLIPRERNANTRKLTSPLPGMDGILCCMAGKPFQTTLDLKAAYEQIQIIPEHVPRTGVTTPDGNVICHVIQQGDCNALATYQLLMNHIFSWYLGVFMDVYLDNILIYSDTLEDHIEHIRIVLRILEEQNLYLSKDKLCFLAD